jgi:hypothetical protein
VVLEDEIVELQKTGMEAAAKPTPVEAVTPAPPVPVRRKRARKAAAGEHTLTT